jgi:hypothetical protein
MTNASEADKSPVMSRRIENLGTPKRKLNPTVNAPPTKVTTHITVGILELANTSRSRRAR